MSFFGGDGGKGEWGCGWVERRLAKKKKGTA